MLVFPALLLMVAAPQAEKGTGDAEKLAIRWKFDPAQTRELHWKGESKIETVPPLEGWVSSNYSFEFTATLAVDRVEEDGTAVGTLNLHQQTVTGLFGGNRLEVVVENSIVKKPNPDSLDDSGKAFIAKVLTPSKVRVSRRGNLEITEPHPLLSKMWWALMLGPVLPSRKQVAVGDSWIGQLQSEEGKRAAEAPFDVEFRFSKVVEVEGKKYAQIVSESRQLRKSQGSDMSFHIKNDALFDPARGVCHRDEQTTTIRIDTPFRGVTHVTKGEALVDFSVLDVKK